VLLHQVVPNRRRRVVSTRSRNTRARLYARPAGPEVPLVTDGESGLRCDLLPRPGVAGHLPPAPGDRLPVHRWAPGRASPREPGWGV